MTSSQVSRDSGEAAPKRACAAEKQERKRKVRIVRRVRLRVERRVTRSGRERERGRGLSEVEMRMWAMDWRRRRVRSRPTGFC